jgi:hypothetical protein
VVKPVDGLVKMLAEKIYRIFEDASIENTSEGNWRVAQGIIRRIVNNEYKAEEFKSFFSDDDYRIINAIQSESSPRPEEDIALP